MNTNKNKELSYEARMSLAITLYGAVDIASGAIFGKNRVIEKMDQLGVPKFESELTPKQRQVLEEKGHLIREVNLENPKQNILFDQEPSVGDFRDRAQNLEKPLNDGGVYHLDVSHGPNGWLVAHHLFHALKVQGVSMELADGTFVDPTVLEAVLAESGWNWQQSKFVIVLPVLKDIKEKADAYNTMYREAAEAASALEDAQAKYTEAMLKLGKNPAPAMFKPQSSGQPFTDDNRKPSWLGDAPASQEHPSFFDVPRTNSEINRESFRHVPFDVLERVFKTLDREMVLKMYSLELNEYEAIKEALKCGFQVLWQKSTAMLYVTDIPISSQAGIEGFAAYIQDTRKAERRLNQASHRITRRFILNARLDSMPVRRMELNNLPISMVVNDFTGWRRVAAMRYYGLSEAEVGGFLRSVRSGYRAIIKADGTLGGDSVMPVDKEKGFGGHLVYEKGAGLIGGDISPERHQELMSAFRKIQQYPTGFYMKEPVPTQPADVSDDFQGEQLNGTIELPEKENFDNPPTPEEPPQS